jgi:phosphatidylglycerophosphatase A
MKVLQDKVQKLFLSLLGIGFVPLSPGTWGSIVSFFILRGFLLWKSDFLMTLIFFAGFYFCIFVLGIRFVILQKKGDFYDHQWIVLDEFVGMSISVLPLFIWNGNLYMWFLALLLFRFFDIRKPFGISKIDQNHTPVSVFLDDVLAGIYTAIIILLILLLI